MLERLKKGARANALRCLCLTAELIKIMDLSARSGVQAMPYKGPVLAVEAYGDVTLREFDDLDIIVRQRDMAKADEVVKGAGYRPQSSVDFRVAARSSAWFPANTITAMKQRRMIVEFHTEWTLRHFPVRPDLDDMARRLVSVALSGHEIPTFAPEDMLPLLCVHGSKDFWERISWIADISEFVRAHPRLDWESWLPSARENCARGGW